MATILTELLQRQILSSFNVISYMGIFSPLIMCLYKLYGLDSNLF
jgi:hypothetical protein